MRSLSLEQTSPTSTLPRTQTTDPRRVRTAIAIYTFDVVYYFDLLYYEQPNGFDYIASRFNLQALMNAPSSQCE